MDSSIAARSMITAQDGSIHLIRNNEHSWTREESLAHSLPCHTLFLDLPVSEPKVRLNVSRRDVLSAYIDRVITHVKQLSDLPSGLAAFARHFATGRYEEIQVESTYRDAFGLRKFIIVATETGKLLAMDSVNHGNIVWSQFFGQNYVINGVWLLRESNAVRGNPPLIGVLATAGDVKMFVQVDGLRGEIIDTEEFKLEGMRASVLSPPGFFDKEGRRLVICVSEKGLVKALPSTDETVSLLRDIGDKLYYFTRKSDAIQGYALDAVFVLSC